MSTWFGRRYDAPAYAPEDEAPVPVGEDCVHCREPILAGDDGFHYANGPAAHRECFVRAIVGSVAHQQRRCSCYGGTGEDDANLTRRQAAKAALDYWERRQ